MTIAELGKKYKLVGKDKDGNPVDLWKCHNNWILTHDACTKIAHIENIKLSKIESIYQSETSCKFLITMVKQDKEGYVLDSITSVGEADKSNCTSNYYGSMAEKRGIDRCVLKLINAYQYGIYSEVEADDFKKENK
jgi:hypothetical protein